MPDAATLESHLAHLNPALAGALRIIAQELRDLHASVHQQTQELTMTVFNSQRTIAAARKLENAADAVVKVLNDTVAGQRTISEQLETAHKNLSDTTSKLSDTTSQLEQALAKINTGSSVGAGELQATVDSLTQQLSDTRTQLTTANQQLSEATSAQGELDALSDEMESKAEAIGEAVVAGTPADPNRSGGAAATADTAQDQGAQGSRSAALGAAAATGPAVTAATNQEVIEKIGRDSPQGAIEPGPGAMASGPMSGVPTAATDASSNPAVAPGQPAVAPANDPNQQQGDQQPQPSPQPPANV